jgi:glyoxylate reductase
MLQERFEVDVWESGDPPSRIEIIQRGGGAVGLLTLLSDSIDRELMIAIGPQLRAIANYAVGFNNIDVHAAKELGIAVGNTPDVLTESTADIAVGLTLAAARYFQPAFRQVQEFQWKTWEPLGFLGQELTGKTLGILGMGRIGQAVAKRLVGGWNMRLIYTARSAKKEIDEKLGGEFVSIEDLFKRSDVLSIHTDLNTTTKHLVNRQTLSWMKPSSILVNTARGGIIDQDALYDALRERKIFAAGLDVTDPEPLPIDSKLRELSNCCILPHIGSATFDSRDAMAKMAASNLIEALAGNTMPYPVG